MKKLEPDSKINLKDFILDVLDTTKAYDVEVIDLFGKTDIANYMIIASGNSDRQIKAIADQLTDKLKECDFEFTVEGMENKDWVLVDTYDVIVHLFKEGTRSEYDLESLWSLKK